MLTAKIDKQQFLEIYGRQVDTVYRLCFSFMKNKADAEDLTQETFLRLLSTGKQFENERHERGWLIVTASNLCKNTLKNWWRRNENLEDYPELSAPETGEDSVLGAVLKLPGEYKDAVYLYYYEGYTTAEMARFLNCPESTVRSRLMRAKRKLKTLLGGGES